LSIHPIIVLQQLNYDDRDLDLIQYWLDLIKVDAPKDTSSQLALIRVQAEIDVKRTGIVLARIEAKRDLVDLIKRNLANHN
jgi:hypothetical protein